MKDKVINTIGALMLTGTFVLASGMSSTSLVEAKTWQSTQGSAQATTQQSQFIQGEDKRDLHERRKLERKQWRKDHHQNYRFWYNYHANPPAYGYYDRYGTYHPMH